MARRTAVKCELIILHTTQANHGPGNGRVRGYFFLNVGQRGVFLDSSTENRCLDIIRANLWRIILRFFISEESFSATCSSDPDFIKTINSCECHRTCFVQEPFWYENFPVENQVVRIILSPPGVLHLGEVGWVWLGLGSASSVANVGGYRAARPCDGSGRCFRYTRTCKCFRCTRAGFRSRFGSRTVSPPSSG